jgi:hypothetical protein
LLKLANLPADLFKFLYNLLQFFFQTLFHYYQPLLQLFLAMKKEPSQLRGPLKLQAKINVQTVRNV